MPRIPAHFFPSAKIEIQHEPGKIVAEFLQDAIDRYPKTVELDNDGRVEETINFRYYPNDGSHEYYALRHPLAGAIKSSGYKKYKRPNVTRFLNKDFEACLFVKNTPDKDGTTRGSIYAKWIDETSNDSWFKQTAMAGSWLTRVCLYHFYNQIGGVSITLTEEPDR